MVVTMTTDYRNRRFLTPEEEALLRLRYPDTSTDDLAAEMGVTAIQISNYAKARRLYKSPAFKEAQKDRTIARLASDKHAAAQRRLQMEAKDKATAMLIQAAPQGEARRTAHGTAYRDGFVTVHVMR